MDITVGNYAIDLFKDHAYSENDSVNKYDIKYLDDREYHYATIIGIKVFETDCLLKSAVIAGLGGATGIHATSFVTETDRITICCSDTIFCLSIPDLCLRWKTNADQATCFQIFKYQSDYIVHGELEISRLGNDGRIIWQRSGADIFTRLHLTKDDFIVTENFILVTDWENRKYKFDFDGNPIP